jgi:beta-glucanase (GH16 family)
MSNSCLFMVLLIALASVSACAAKAHTPTVIPAPSATLEPQWTLVWADEFEQPDGSPPSPQNWIHNTGGHGWGNSELQYYTEGIENAYIENNMLVIEVVEERYMGLNYTSARLSTLTLAQFTYGRIEVRARLPNTQGIWPAIWMLPSIGGGWPTSGEIDIMELVGKEPSRVYGTLHYGNPYENQGGWFDLPDGATYDQEFHVFSIEWEAEEIRWYVDGQVYFKADEWFTSMPNSPYPAPFDKPFYLILNVAVGGVWADSPDETSVFPQTMIVDYVRVYLFK